MTTVDKPEISHEKLLERRLEYAWKYFDSAAQKRMQFVNVFVLLSGILANGYVIAVGQHRYWQAAAICLFGVICSVTFMIMDHRMLVFVTRALLVLETIERETLFPDGYSAIGPAGARGSQLGLARSEPDDAAHGMPLRWYTKVKFWIRVMVMGGAGVLFAIAGVLAALAATGRI